MSTIITYSLFGICFLCWLALIIAAVIYKKQITETREPIEEEKLMFCYITVDLVDRFDTFRNNLELVIKNIETSKEIKDDYTIFEQRVKRMHIEYDAVFHLYRLVFPMGDLAKVLELLDDMKGDNPCISTHVNDNDILVSFVEPIHILTPGDFENILFDTSKLRWD